MRNGCSDCGWTVALDRIRERDHFPTARGSGTALNRQSTALAVPPGRQFSRKYCRVQRRTHPMATTAVNTLRFARRSKDTGVPAAQAETMAEPVFTPVGAVVRLRLGRSRRARGRRPPGRGAQPRARRGNRGQAPRRARGAPDPARVGGLDLAPDSLRKRRLHDGARRMGPLGRPVAEARPEPVRNRKNSK